MVSACALQRRGAVDTDDLEGIPRCDDVEPGPCGDALEARHECGPTRGLQFALGQKTYTRVLAPEPLSLGQIEDAIGKDGMEPRAAGRAPHVRMDVRAAGSALAREILAAILIDRGRATAAYASGGTLAGPDVAGAPCHDTGESSLEAFDALEGQARQEPLPYVPGEKVRSRAANRTLEQQL